MIGAGGMLCCLAAVVLLIMTTADIPDHRLYHTVAFALFGVGLGVFIAPNNTATLAAVPTELSGAAGSMLNLIRSLGTSLGVAAGAAMLSWSLRADASAGESWLTASSESLAFLTRGWVHPTFSDFLLMAACGVIAAAALTLLSHAYKSAPASIVAPFEYFAIILSIAYGWFIWGELPDLLAIIGISVVIAAGFYVVTTPRNAA